ncbi:MAG: YebC/PmpR family DNA-binding transcriptional regulator [Defluviitaleaceae bacterium]|nr:YebC/PmpR family DNA-binding transcriptional regulator [Defluviitaleaceae bacterium]
MAGHSKFANIKHKKERMDAKRGKIFTKIGREIAIAVKAGGADPVGNVALKNIIQKAKSNNMPNDTIDRAIKKASGDLGAVNYDSVTYEGYGPSGVAVIVEALTDNRTRTAANVRNAFTKGDGSIGTQGCVGYLFEKTGIILLEGKSHGTLDEDALMELVLDAGATDFVVSDDGYEIQTGDDEDAYSAVSDAFAVAGIVPVSSEMTMLPSVYVKLTDPMDIKKINKLLDLLEDDDDVVSVYNNWEQEN